MGASLSTAERQILEAAQAALVGGASRADLTDGVRRTLGHLPGPVFRRGVANLTQRGLLRARVATKVDGDVGRVMIEGLTPLGRSAIRQWRRAPLRVLPD